MRHIIGFFAKEHLFGNLLTLFLLGVGLFSLFSINRNLWPDIDFNTTVVTAVLPGSSPEQVEKLVLNPIEEAIREVDGLKKVFATATESQAVIILQLDKDARDQTKTNRDIRQVIDQIDDFPDDVEDPIVREVDSTQMPVIDVTISSETKSDLQVREVARYISDKLRRVKGVASIRKIGELKREYRIEVDPVKLANRQVSLADIVAAVSQQNITLPAGSTSSAQGREILVKTDAEYKSLDDIYKTIVKSNQAGFNTTVADVAKVYESLAKPERLYKANGKRGILLSVAKKGNADAIQVVENIEAAIDELRPRLDQGFEIGFTRDFTVYLRNRIKTLGSNFAVGLLLVLIMLAVFLPWQVTLVVAVGIPLALLSTIGVMYLTGQSLNMISLLGLIIVLGMLVDDAIVVCENIWRHIESGDDLVKAVTDGASEVFIPVLSSILTTVSAFGPMLFMTGVFGAFIYEIPSVVILALFFSLFEAFIIMPSHFVSWVGPFIQIGQPSEDQPSQKKQTHWYDKWVKKYQNFVRWSLQRRYRMLSICMGLVLAIGALTFATGRFKLFPGEGGEFFFIQLEAPTDTSIEKMAELTRVVEDVVKDLPKDEMKDFITSIGIIQQDPNDPQTRRGSHFGQVQVSLTARQNRLRSVWDIIDDVKSRIGHPPQFERITFEVQKEGPPQGRTVSINLIGPDRDELANLAVKVETEMRKIQGIIDIRNSNVTGKVQWNVIPRSEDLLALGLTATDVATTVRASFEGLVASTSRELDEEIDIRVLLSPGQGEVVEQLKNLKIGNRLGNLIPLNQVADFEKSESVNSISHYEFDRRINISAEVNEELLTGTEAAQKLKETLPPLVENLRDYKILFGGEDEDTAESMASLGRAFIFAIALIIFLLITVFRNMIQPILILTSIPLGFMGVSIAVWVHNKYFSFLAMLGMVALAGVIVNNAIVFIDFVNSLRSRGQDLDQSIIETAGVRMRPIILTTTTTVAGLVPTAYGDYLFRLTGFGGSDPFVVPLALALGWGLAFGSVMTMIFFPAFVRITDDIRRYIRI